MCFFFSFVLARRRFFVFCLGGELKHVAVSSVKRGETTRPLSSPKPKVAEALLDSNDHLGSGTHSQKFAKSYQNQLPIHEGINPKMWGQEPGFMGILRVQVSNYLYLTLPVRLRTLVTFWETILVANSKFGLCWPSTQEARYTQFYADLIWFYGTSHP